MLYEWHSFPMKEELCLLLIGDTGQALQVDRVTDKKKEHKKLRQLSLVFQDSD